MKKILLIFIFIFSISFGYYNCKGTLKEDMEYLTLNLEVAQFFKREGMSNCNIKYLKKSLESYKISQDILDHIENWHKNQLLINESYSELSLIQNNINESIESIENTLKKFKKIDLL